MSAGDQTAPQYPAPVDPRMRIEAADMVRGFALFGVLLVNMFNFGAYSIVWTEPEDELAFSAMRFFFETKSWRLFALLFGFGFALQLIRVDERGSSFAPVYLRRLLILFIIGAGHAMFYDGDILMHYAELGLLLMLFRNVSPRLLLVLAICLLAVFPVGHAVTSYFEPKQIAPTADYAARLEEATAEMEEDRRSHVYVVGSVREVMVANAKLESPFEGPLTPESSVAVFAMFLVGLYVGRRRIMSDITGHLQLIRRVFRWGLPIGLISMAAERILNATTGYTVFREQQAGLLPQLLGDVIFTFGSTALALAYAAGITLLAQSVRGRQLLTPLSAAGRMALTVYISSSIMFGTLYYGFAFGNAFLLGPAAVAGYAVLFFAVQISFCVWWTKRYRFGPVEWLWRALTYMRFPPMKL